MQRLLDLFQRHHLAADLGEPRQPARDRDVALGVDAGHVAGDVPAVEQHRGGQLGLVQVALHDVRAVDHEQPSSPGGKELARLGVDGAGRDARQRRADGADAVVRLGQAAAHLVGQVGRDDRRQFGAAVALQRQDAEAC